MNCVRRRLQNSAAFLVLLLFNRLKVNTSDAWISATLEVKGRESFVPGKRRPSYLKLGLTTSLAAASLLYHHGIRAGVLPVSPAIWCDSLHDWVWHLSGLVPWEVEENVHCACFCNILAGSCAIGAVFKRYMFVCVVVLEWRKTKQLKLTCITAPTVRLHMGRLSVSRRPLCLLVLVLLACVYF